ncbi:hypothetical protein OSB04_027155 [Centaurea solstitialis]|uniref:UDP-glycosyltransferase n=1 Tax=Centaurea solstitialis TaxID=347529 RepID=A0AA38W7Z4_9ASTR|nr:hypothetical protein OSB04_027155 [Centaurea solstitialis]
MILIEQTRFAALVSQPWLCIRVGLILKQPQTHKNMEMTHVIAIPYPAQGHVIPLMEFAQRLVKQGIKVTFINTEVTHKLVTSTWLQKDDFSDLMQMVSLPDGLEPTAERNDLAKQTEAIFQTMPAKLEELINTINKKDDSKITCVITDINMGWALPVAEKMGIRRASFWPASAITLATVLSLQKLIDDGIINHNGEIFHSNSNFNSAYNRVPLNDNILQLSPCMPPIKPAHLWWACMGDLVTIKIVFKALEEVAKAVLRNEWIICNSSHHLESAAFSLFPQALSIGPLLASNRLAKQAGHFWPEDSTCLTWLNQQPACSVIYIAFGSFTIFDQAQFEELALGLELTNRPFLWVVRPGITKEISYPQGYMDRVGSRGRIVSWAPQQEVLSHPSVACFMSHCGWNSTLEGVNNGVPFICWPYFADQFQDEAYICDIWENGLALKKNIGGIVTGEEIKSKVNKLLSDTRFKDNALALKEKALSSIRKGGSSEKNLSKFIEWIKEKDNHLSS